MRRLLTGALVGLLLMSACKHTEPENNGGKEGEQPDWIVGGDLSLLPSFTAARAVYKDINGNPVQPLDFFKAKGLNYVRVRLFVDPDTQSAACQDYAYVSSFIRQVKTAGFMVLLDFHYSDTWADPGKQYIPQAWKGLSDQALAQKVYDYTKATLQQLVADQAAPNMIQIGNEISNGILWDQARVSVWASERTWNTTARWTFFTGILSNASKACREVCPQALIMLHYDNGGSAQGTSQFFNQMMMHQVDYDLIGLSYYAFWHGSLNDLKASIDGLRATFPAKKVNVVEVAYPNNEWGIDEGASYSLPYPATPHGQRDFMKAFLATLHTCSNCNGYMYWFPEETYTPDGGLLVLHRGVFDPATGKALPITEVLSN